MSVAYRSFVLELLLQVDATDSHMSDAEEGIHNPSKCGPGYLIILSIWEALRLQENTGLDMEYWKKASSCITW